MKIKNISIGMSLIILSAFLFSTSQNVFGEDASTGGSETSYTIKKGDTLWDISEGYLKNPFLWPSLWKYNKFIKNPDMIFPGDKLIIPGPGIDALSKTEPAGQQPAKSDAGQEEIPEEGFKPLESSAAMPVPPLPEDIDVPESIRSASPYISQKPSSAGETGKVSGKQMPAPIINEETVFMGGYIADKVSSAGVVSISQEDRNVFAAGDTVNILFTKKEKAVIGDKFAIIRKPTALINAETGKQYGLLSVPIGVLEIYRIQGRDAGGRIIKSYDYITEGDMIQRFQSAVPVLKITKSGKGIKGHIIGLRGETVLASERNIVYLDKGTKDGLTPGVVLNVSGEDTNNLIGELMVISVQSSTSTALVTKSIEPFGVGSLFFLSP